ncbi:helix-turn-helix domain-containing protein [Oerskovia paurometabola]|uniref:helix-turn-helix domain-containing protein n=1 Tax=Oerskovia paurometabola TaxID=162170 RepID=UPI0038071481
MGTNSRIAGPWTEAIAAEIRAERARQKLSQVALAEASGVPRSTLVKLEAGSRPIDMEQLRLIADALGISQWELVQRAEANSAGLS